MNLENTGWLKTNQLLNASEIHALKQKLSNKNSNSRKVYQLDKSDMQLPEIQKLIYYFQNKLSTSEIYSKTVLQKIWRVQTTETNSTPGKLPYIPHFDRRRFVKLMVYLNDVTTADGPFTTASHSVDLYEVKRRNLPDDYKDKKLNSKLEAHDYNEVLFTSGTGVIFDTNCAHYAKPVQAGGGRDAIRIDFEDYRWNRHLDSWLTQVGRFFG